MLSERKDGWKEREACDSLLSLLLSYEAMNFLGTEHIGGT